MYSFLQHISIVQEKANAQSAPSIQLNNWMADLNKNRIERSEMNKLVMNYLVVEGFKEAAEKFRLESGLEPPQSLDSLDNRIQIRAAVESGRIDDAIDLTNTFNPDVLDCNPCLFFHLQQQKLIEYIRDKRIEKALEFAQNVMAELGAANTKFLKELEQTMALLAFENPEASPFGELMNITHRHVIAGELNAAILDNEHQETTPNIANVMKLVLWTQNELDKKHIRYPKMVDLANGTIKNPSDDKITTITIA